MRSVNGSLCFPGSNDHRFNYDEHLGRDDVAARHFAGTRVGVIDLRMTHWRADAHVGKGDCMHFCMTSSVLSSTFPVMLSHALRVGAPIVNL